MANAASKEAVPGAQFTPGPWSAIRNSCFWEIESGAHGMIGDACASHHIHADDGKLAPEQAELIAAANARLMAAAPEMFAALKQLEAYAEVQVRRHPDATDTPIWQSVLSALAKASEPRS